MHRIPRVAAQRLYTGYCLVLFTAMGLTVLGVNLFLPSLRRRRQVAGAMSRAFLRAAGIPFRVEGLQRLPQVPCVVVANHASYIDGLVAAAALPPDFAFVIKKEMVRVPLAGMLLRGERGMPIQPLTVQIPGVWREGDLRTNPPRRP